MDVVGSPRLTLEDLAEIEPPPDTNLFTPVRMSIETRPQDWAEPARRILRERGAWRGRA